MPTQGKSFLAVLVLCLLQGCFANPTPHPQVDASDPLQGGADTTNTTDATAADTSQYDGASDTGFIGDLAGLDTGQFDDGAAQADSQADGQSDGDVGPADDGASHDGSGPQSCGVGAGCGQEQACVTAVPGVCGGPAPGTDGCEPGCTESDCGDGSPVCICPQVGCEDLGNGCSDCSCLSADYESCDCQEEDGTVRITCYLP